MSEEDFTIDVRAHIVAHHGGVLGIVDLSQIEPRCLAWLCGDWDFLELVKTMSPYEAHARLFMNWTGGKLKKENPRAYSLAKARVLALGYGAGWEKFIFMCRTYGIMPEEVLADPVGPREKDAFVESLLRSKRQNGKLDEFAELDVLGQRIWVNAWLQVMDFRNRNVKILNLWRKLEAGFKASVVDGTYEMGLPSGRSLWYYGINSIEGQWKAQTERGGKFEKFYGGKLCENLIQATARDVFGECIRRLEEQVAPVLFHVHDEVILGLEDTSQLGKAIQIMSMTPAWLPGCPISAEGHCSPRYTK
ncbi:MAG: hypothetical protein ABI162_06930 [Luteolibacter sp.]